MAGSTSRAGRPSAALYAGVVLYDAGSKSRDTLTFGFEREDFEVFSTEQPAEALSLLQVSGAPILAISVGPDPAARVEALSFIGDLRDRADKKNVVVVVLAQRELREDALRAGADEFVAWPAFIRDAVTLARLALANRPEGGGVSGLLEDYEVYFLVRALAAAGRSAVVELERAGHKGSLHFARGELVAARVGRLAGVAAFHHLLLWGQATLKLHFASPPGERKIHAPVDELLQTGVRFVEEFERLAVRVGGPQATFERRADKTKLDDPTLKVPTEVRRFAETVVSGATLVDLVESSPFKPFDTIKVCYRLLEVGIVSKRDPVRSISPLTAQLAVRDWLLGTAVPEQRSTVTEAGRRAAEAYAEAAALRANVPLPDPSEEIFGVDKMAPDAILSPLQAEGFAHAEPEPTSYLRDVPLEHRAPVSRPIVDPTPATSESARPEAAKPEAAKPEAAKPEAATNGSLADEDTQRIVEKLTIEDVDAPVFDDVDEAFFAAESELHRIDPVESFDDLDEASSKHAANGPAKKRWSLFGEQPQAQKTQKSFSAQPHAEKTQKSFSAQPHAQKTQAPGPNKNGAKPMASSKTTTSSKHTSKRPGKKR